MLTIDGSLGEGGGQILRTAIALSLVTGTQFRIEKIRAGRKKPGLIQQHLTAVNAAAEIGQATIQGASIGSSELVFQPGMVRAGNYQFAMGTAGSTTLVLQTISQALFRASGQSTITLRGGTHNPSAPPFDFLQKTFLPIVKRLGPDVTVTLERHGFYPAGGGILNAIIQPSPKLKPIELLDRGAIRRHHVKAVIARLPRHIADRELHVIRKQMLWGEECVEIEKANKSSGPGNAVMIEIESEAVTEIFTGFAQRGVPAESIAEGVVKEARHYLEADVPVGEHLADQLLLPLALAGNSSFTTLPLSQHSKTNIEVIRRFLDVEISTEQLEREKVLVKVQ